MRWLFEKKNSLNKTQLTILSHFCRKIFHFSRTERNTGTSRPCFPLFSYYNSARIFSRSILADASRIFFSTSIFLARSHLQLLRIFLYPLMLLSLSFAYRSRGRLVAGVIMLNIPSASRSLKSRKTSLSGFSSFFQLHPS